jgi:cysteine desulfurase
VFGGGQEQGLRSGTQNVAAICGLAKALEIVVANRIKESERLSKLRDYAIKKIISEIPGCSLNGDIEHRLPNNINICFAGADFDSKGQPRFDSEFLVIKLDTLGFAVSAASACHALSLENGSYVVESLGKKDCSSSSLRMTLGRQTKKADLDKFITALKSIFKK